MAYDLLWEPEGVLVQFSGIVTPMDLINSVEEAQGDSRFDEMHYAINDLSEIASHQLSDDAFIQVSAINFGAHASNPNCRIAYVTTDPLLSDLVKQSLSSGDMASYQTEVFATVSDARDWIESQPKLHILSNVMGFRSH